MISIDEKLYITKEVNNIVVRYVKEIVLRQLLLQFSFKNPEKPKKITNILENVHFDMDAINPETQFEVLNFTSDFLKTLDKEKLLALYFWVINENYFKYLDNTSIDDSQDSIKSFDHKFGRELAYKIYNPKSSELEDELDKNLKQLLYNFASEFDLSLINKHTKHDVIEMIDKYSN